jgi:predicted Zn-dependent peptidase
MNITRHILAIGAVAGLAVAAVPAARAQAPGQDTKAVSVSKVERKNLAPVSKEILRVKLPKPVEATLDNGLTVLILEDHRFPTISTQLLIRGAGGLYEPENLPGLANVTATMMREGTTKLNSRQIAEAVDRMGATVGVGGGLSSATATLTASGLSDNFDEWFGLAVDILMNPSFPADELGKLRDRMKVQLRQVRASPQFLMAERFNKVMFGTHPGAKVVPTPESVDAMTPELLAKWHRERYVPQAAILAIAGDVRASEVLPKLKTWLGGWQKSDWKETLPPNPAPATAKKIYVVDRPGSVQSVIQMGNIAIDRRSADYVPMVVLNRVLGGGPAARLFLNLREEKGYTYGVYSNFSAVQYPGPWQAGGEVTDGAMKEFVYELTRIRDQKVPAAELEEAKRAMVASFALSLESPAQLLSYAITRKLYGFSDEYWDTYPAKLLAVTAEDVQRAAQKYMNADAMQVVVVGDAKQVKTVLEKYGPVEVYDTEGKPVAARSGN